jgi:glutamate carboxypeptidase
MRLYEKARDLADVFGYTLGETQVGGASDGNFVGALGVPVLDGLGVAGAGAHTLDEHILLSDIAPRATLLTLLLADGLKDLDFVVESWIVGEEEEGKPPEAK